MGLTWLLLIDRSSPPDGSQGTDRSGQQRAGRGDPGGLLQGASEWGAPAGAPGSTTSGSPASAQTPLYSSMPSAGLLAKLQVSVFPLVLAVVVQVPGAGSATVQAGKLAPHHEFVCRSVCRSGVVCAAGSAGDVAAEDAGEPGGSGPAGAS